VEITVLGKSPAIPDANGAGSGYLVTDSDCRVLVDCGSGVFARLLAVCEPTDVAAVVITHLHADHIIDLIPYSHTLTYAYHERDIRPLLLAPPGSNNVLARIAEAFGMPNLFEDAFELREYDPAVPAAVRHLGLRFQEVPHFVRTWACELRSAGGKRFTFGADCGPNDALPQFATGTDLLMLEATEGVTPPPAESAAPRGHLTAGEAGELAHRANAKRLVLTHFSDLLDSHELRRGAMAGFGAPVELARQGASFVI